MPALSTINPAKNAAAVTTDRGLYRRRRLLNKVGLGFAASAMIFGLFWLTWILRPRSLIRS